MEFSSKGIKLEVCETEDGTYKEMYGFYSVPDLGQEPDNVDVTNFADDTERGVDSGVKKIGRLAFDAYINIKEADESETGKILESYKYLREKQEAGVKLWNKLTYPDGGTHKWKGSPAAWRLAANVKEALKFRYSTSVESKITETFGTGGQTSGSSGGAG